MVDSTTTSDPSQYFVDDDEELLRFLTANDLQFDNFSTRLKELAQRFQEDHDHSASAHQQQWSEWTGAAQQVGFRLNESVSAASTSSGPTGNFPAAFDSESGKQHLTATTALLGVTDRRAVQLTMSLVRGMKEDTANLQALLGTQALLEKVMDYHYRQRSARIAAIAQLLRLEQADIEEAAHSSIVEILSILDSSYTNDGEKRGLFRYFVVTSCQKEDSQKPSRQQLLPAKELLVDAPTSLDQAAARPSDETTLWHQFVARCLNSNRNRVYQERVGSLEALSALLYNTIQVNRTDYMILLLAFRSAGTFFTENLQDQRLSQLAGLVCVECMGLWRALGETAEDTDVQWVVDHPILMGVVGEANSDASSSQAETEIQALRSILEQLSNNVSGRDSPESLALMSFGLLLLLSYNAVLGSRWGADSAAFWQVFPEAGQKLVETASDNLGALDYLHQCMGSLISAPLKYGDGRRTDLPYDWLFVGREKTTPMEICSGEEGQDLDAQSMVFASIGHEMLNAIVLVFGDTILSVHHTAALSNLAMICDLASRIYRNSSQLCETFWADWELFTSPTPPAVVSPLCRVMDSAAMLASHADQADRKTKDQVLASLVPLVQLLASLCYSPEKVEFAFGAIPPAMLQKSLVSCAPDYHADGPEFIQNRLRFLGSLATLTRVGDSPACRDVIRAALQNEMQRSMSTTGPGLLLKALATPDVECRTATFNIVADLLKDSPVPWTLTLAQGLQHVLTPNDENSSTYAVSRVFNELARSILPVAFSKSVSSSEAEAYLNIVWGGVLRLSPLLSLCLSNVAGTKTALDVKTASSILEYFSVILESVGPIISHHRSAPLQSAAGGIRDAIIETLATGSIGESVMFYALLPLASSMAYSIETYADEQKIAEFATREENSAEKYGAWYETLHRNPASTKSSESQLKVKDIIENDQMNFEIVTERSGITLDEMILTAAKALRLLRLWALSVDDMVSGQDSGALVSRILVALDNEQSERLLSLSPQRLLVARATLPQPQRSQGNVKSCWDSVSPTNLQLLTRYFEANMDGSILETSLDFLHACVAHVKRSGAEENFRDATLCTLIQQSNLADLVAPLAEVSLRDATEGDKKENMALCVLAFRFLAITLPVVSVEGFGKSLMTAAFDGVRGTCEDLHKFREDGGFSTAVDIEVLDKLQLSVACLCFLRAIWIDADRLEPKLELTNQYSDISTFSGLVKVVIQHSRSKRNDDAISDGAKGALFSFLACAVDFLCLTTDYALRNGKTMNSSLIQLLGEDSNLLIGVPEYFTTMSSCQAVVTTSQDFFSSAALGSDKMALARPENLMHSFPITAVRDFDSVFFNVDVSTMTAAIASLEEETPCDDDLKRTILLMAMAHHFFSSQAALLLQWKRFVDTLVRVSKQNMPSGGNRLAMGRGEENPFLSAAIETLRIINDNTNMFESHKLALNPVDVGRLATSMVSLVLLLVTESIDSGKQAPPSHLVSILGLVSSCASKLFDLLGSDAPLCIQVEQQLLAAAIGILDNFELPPSMLDAPLNDEIMGGLVLITNRLLKLLKSQERDCDCFKTCIVLLSQLTSTGFDAPESTSREAPLCSLAERFKDLRVMEALVNQLMTYSMMAPQTMSDMSGSLGHFDQKEDAEYMDLLECFFDLVFLLAQSSDMIEVLDNSGSLQLLARMGAFEQSSPVGAPGTKTTPSLRHFRGYIPTQERFRMRSPSNDSNDSVFVGKDDPRHLLWRKSLRCFTALLRTSRSNLKQSQSKKDRFQGLVADFIFMHQSTMMSCLTAIESSSFTRNSLSEAALIMALLAEFCTRPCRDRRAHRAILDEFGPIAVLLVARLGSFLGASSTSREFFNDGDEENDDSDFEIVRHSPYSRVINHAHEAIRYSHYAYRFYNAVTREDFANSSAQNSDDLRSDTSLEKHAKAMMSCHFAEEIEMKAARCLYATISFLWELSQDASFVMFSQDQASRIDTMSLVKPGMAIAFASDLQNDGSRTSSVYSSGFVNFCQVEHIDTVDKKMYVRDLVSRETFLVPSGAVVGVEDVSKRKCVLRYAPAPDSATELEIKNSASVGHLILALRWCAGTNSASHVVKRLASLSTALLGSEIVMNELVGGTIQKKKEEVERLQAQLLDLYDGDNGRLKTVLSESTWVAIRQQLSSELESAAEAETSRNAKNDMMVVEDGLFSRNSSRNPFHDLRMTY